MFVAEAERIPSSGGVATPLGSAVPSDRDVPIPLVMLVGRDEIVSQIVGRSPCRRFATIAGTGAVGKSTVSLTIARKLARSFRRGAVQVDFGALAGSLMVAMPLASNAKPAKEPPLTDEMTNLRALVEKSVDVDLLRRMIGFAAQRLMELEVEEPIRGPTGSRTVRSTTIVTGPGRRPPAASH